MEATKKTNAQEKSYELVPPDGGWGYVVAGAMVVIFNVTVLPISAFGLIYGGFLRSLGDETTGTTVSNGVFNIVSSFTGIIASGLLSKYSYRTVAMMGCLLFVTGAASMILLNNLIQMIIFFGVIQGLGVGLLIPAIMSAFNSYFDKKMNLIMSAAQTFMVAFNSCVPPVAAWSVRTWGFRGTLIGLAVLSCLSIPAVATLRPVKRYMKKVYLEEKSTVVHMQNMAESKKPLEVDVEKSQVEPLMLQDSHHLSTSQRSLQTYHLKPRLSVVSLGSRIASVTALDEPKVADPGLWKSFVASMDLSLLKSAKYINISVGMGLCFAGDITFISIAPMILGNLNFSTQQIGTMMAVFFGCDFVARIGLTVISSMLHFRNRVLFLFAAGLTVIARTALVLQDGYMWKLVFLGAIGFLRCFIHTPIPLVLAEEYPQRFSSAFSLSMALSGTVMMVLSVLIGVAKKVLDSDVALCHLLTLAYTICVVSWTIDLTLCRKRTKGEEVK